MSDLARHWCGKDDRHSPHIGCNGFGYFAGPPEGLCRRQDRHPAHVSCDGRGDVAPAAVDLEAALARYAGPGVPRHGRGSLPHGYVEGAGCGDECNNIQCPAGETHERCSVDCLRKGGVALLEIPVWRGLLLGRRDLLT